MNLFPRIFYLDLEGFQRFREHTRFEFGAVTLLYGPNSTGKSAVSDALQVINAFWQRDHERVSSMLNRWAFRSTAEHQRNASIVTLSICVSARELVRGLNFFDNHELATVDAWKDVLAIEAAEFPYPDNSNVATRQAILKQLQNHFWTITHVFSRASSLEWRLTNISIEVDHAPLFTVDVSAIPQSGMRRFGLNPSHPLIAQRAPSLEWLRDKPQSETKRGRRVTTDPIDFGNNLGLVQISLHGAHKLSLEESSPGDIDVSKVPTRSAGRLVGLRSIIEWLWGIARSGLNGGMVRLFADTSLVGATRPIPAPSDLVFVFPGAEFEEIDEIEGTIKGKMMRRAQLGEVPQDSTTILLQERLRVSPHLLCYERLAFDYSELNLTLLAIKQFKSIYSERNELLGSERENLVGPAFQRVNQQLRDHLFLDSGYQLQLELRHFVTGSAIMDPPKNGNEFEAILRSPVMVSISLVDAQGRTVDLHDVGSGISNVLPMLIELNTSGATVC